MLNAIDNAKTGRRAAVFARPLLTLSSWTRATVAFSKYRAILIISFDAILVGLTATKPMAKTTSTYDFSRWNGIPTYAYVTTRRSTPTMCWCLLQPEVRRNSPKGITTTSFHRRIKTPLRDDDFAEDDTCPPLSHRKAEWFIANANTVDTVLQDPDGAGHQDGRQQPHRQTIIFAQNKRHAEFIRGAFLQAVPAARTAAVSGFVSELSATCLSDPSL